MKGVKRLKPIETNDTNIICTLEGCGDLPAVAAHDENGTEYIITAWEISHEELERLKETGIMYLLIVGTGVPPVLLTVDNPLIEEGDE